MRKQLANEVLTPITTPLAEGEFKPSIHCDASLETHRRIEEVVKVHSDGITTTLKGTCATCGGVRIYTETLKADFSTPIVGRNYLRAIIK